MSYLDRLDQFVKTRLMPQYNRGRLRKTNPEYKRVENALLACRPCHENIHTGRPTAVRSK